MIANQILNYLWLGDIDSATDKFFLKKYNIRTIINMTKNNYTTINGIKVYQYCIDDPGANCDLKEENVDKMSKFLPKIVKIIDSEITKKNSVLVHCQAGIQRSATVVAAYILYKHRDILGEILTIKDVLDFLKNKRGIAFYFGHEINFLPALIKFRKQLLQNSI